MAANKSQLSEEMLAFEKELEDAIRQLISAQTSHLIHTEQDSIQTLILVELALNAVAVLTSEYILDVLKDNPEGTATYQQGKLDWYKLHHAEWGALVKKRSEKK